MTAVPPGGDFEEDLLCAYVDGELDPQQRARLEAALAGSSALRAVLAEVAEARAAVRGLPWPEAPHGFWDRVTATLADLAPEATGSPVAAGVLVPSRHRWSGSRRLLAATGAAAAVALVAGVALVPPSDTHTVRPPVAAQVDAHATLGSIDADPIWSLAPIGTPVSMVPPPVAK